VAARKTKHENTRHIVKQKTGEKRRISFLMPYIDFCFMLIIIFIGMLSIAYFEPLGASDYQTKKETKLEQVQGRFEVRPTGIETQNAGVGMETPAGTMRPLVAPLSNAPQLFKPRAGSMKPNPTQKPKPNQGQKPSQFATSTANTGAGPDAGNVDLKLKGPGDVSKEELERLKKQLEEAQKQSRQLQEQAEIEKGTGNHLYIDLRNQK
jgi:hypothetical protein